MGLLVVAVIISFALVLGANYIESEIVQWTLRCLAGVLTVSALIVLGYRHEWTGFGESTQRQEVRPKKTLWDWLALLVIPGVLAVGGFSFAFAQNNQQQAIEEQRAQAAALQAYFDQMSSLMLDKKLRDSDPESEVRTLAQARTASVITRLDAEDNRTLTQFLDQANLLGPEEDSISIPENTILEGADLERASLYNANLESAVLRDANLKNAFMFYDKLSNTDLTGADLSGAILIGADFASADLTGADLRGAHLEGADLSGLDLTHTDIEDAYLRNANLKDAVISQEQLASTPYLEEATMPDGSTHPGQAPQVIPLEGYRIP